jgi:type I restriction enzyme R subunit
MIPIHTEEARRLVLDQLLAKLQRKLGKLKGERLRTFRHLAGADPAVVLAELKSATPAEARRWFAERPALPAWLDEKVFEDRWVLVSTEEDGDVEMTQDFEGRSADDYLDGF